MHARPQSIHRRALASLAATLLVVGTGGAAPAPEGPRLLVRDPVHDFGTVYEGAVLEHTFEMTTAGDADLVIQKIKPSCGCTVAEVWRVDEGGERAKVEEGTPIPPGSTIELVARFETKRRRGKQTKPVSIYSNSPAGAIEVKIEAQVETLFVATPQAIDLGRFSVRESGDGEATVSTADGDAVGLSVDAASLPEGLSVDLTALQPDADGRSARWRVRARLAEGASEGYFRHQVELVTDRPHPDAPAREDGSPSPHTYELRVDAQVSGLVTATPRYLSFGLVRGDALVSKALRVNLYDPAMELPTPTWKLLDGKKDQPFQLAAACAVHVRPVEGVRGWDVEMAIDQLPPAFQGAFHGRLVLDFGDSGVESLEISFTGFHRPDPRRRSGPPVPGERP